MVEHWSEKPGVDSSILSLGTSFWVIFVLLIPVSCVFGLPSGRSSLCLGLAKRMGTRILIGCNCTIPFGKTIIYIKFGDVLISVLTLNIIRISTVINAQGTGTLVIPPKYLIRRRRRHCPHKIQIQFRKINGKSSGSHVMQFFSICYFGTHYD